MNTQRAEFIAAILDAPEDDDLRLVCADWFEDQGDEASTARAEFIRTQIERSRLPFDDPRQSEWTARELRLLKQYGPVWCGSHFVFRKCRFRRGFIETVHLHLQHYLHHRRQMLALEPVRELQLTGWHRAPDHLIDRVAGCEELRYVERLRIHHQGPHKHPRGNLIRLLESPHLSGVQSLHCAMAEFDAETRRRFERLPLLARLRELHLPYLETFPQDPGPWFSDGAADLDRWRELRSLVFPDYTRIEFLQQVMQSPVWRQLTDVEVGLSYAYAEEFTVALAQDLPPVLERIALSGESSPSQVQGETRDAFLAALANRPLRECSLDGLPISADALGDFLSDPHSRLRSLSLHSCDLNERHARAIANAPGVQSLQTLDLAGNLRLAKRAMQTLVNSPYLKSVVRLDLSGAGAGNDIATTLAASDGWRNLRSLDLQFTRIQNVALLQLLQAPVGRRLNWLSLRSGGYPDKEELHIGQETVDAITKLPNLQCLRFSYDQPDDGPIRNLERAGSPAWVLTESLNEHDEAVYRAIRAPSRVPPVDDFFENVRDWVPD